MSVSSRKWAEKSTCQPTPDCFNFNDQIPNLKASPSITGTIIEKFRKVVTRGALHYLKISLDWSSRDRCRNLPPQSGVSFFTHVDEFEAQVNMHREKFSKSLGKPHQVSATPSLATITDLAFNNTLVTGRSR